MTQQIMLNKREQETNQAYLVENEAKNPFSTIVAVDIIGLSWIFKNEDSLEELK